MGLYYVFFGAQMLFLLPASILLLQKEGDFLSGVLTVILFFLIGQGLKEPLENMMNLVVGMNRIQESVRRIDAILYQPELTAEGSEIPETYDVTYENVSFSYDGCVRCCRISISMLRRGWCAVSQAPPAVAKPPS